MCWNLVIALSPQTFWASMPIRPWWEHVRTRCPTSKCTIWLKYQQKSPSPRKPPKFLQSIYSMYTTGKVDGGTPMYWNYHSSFRSHLFGSCAITLSPLCTLHGYLMVYTCTCSGISGFKIKNWPPWAVHVVRGDLLAVLETGRCHCHGPPPAAWRWR